MSSPSISSKTVLPFLISFACLQAEWACGDIVLSLDSRSVKSNQVIFKATELVQQGQISQARETLADLASEPDQFHPELVLSELLLQHNEPRLARVTMERFSATSGPRFDLFLAYAKLALREQRWFDAFVHAQLAARQPMPDSWTDSFKADNQVELDKVRMESVAARGNWEHVKELAAKYLINSETGKRLTAAEEQAQQTDLGILELAAKAEFYLDNARETFAIYSLLADIRADGTDPYVEVGKLYESSGNQERAEVFFEKAVQSNPMNALSGLEFARWLLWSNRAEEAATELNKLESAVEFSKERDYLLAMVHRMNGDAISARSLLEELYAGDPKSFAIRNQLALVLIESSDTSDHSHALEIAQENVRTNPANIDAWSTLGWVQLKLDLTDEASQSLAKAAQFGQVSRDTAYFLSQLKFKLGETAAAEELQGQAEQAEGPFFYADK